MHDDQSFAPWGTVSPSFWRNAAMAEPAGPPPTQPPAASYQPEYAPAPSAVREPSQETQTRPEAPLPPPVPGTRIVPEPAADEKPFTGTEDAPPHKHDPLAAWRNQAATTARYFEDHARTSGKEREAARWARVRHEVESLDAPWGAAAELWLAIASSLVVVGQTEEATVVLRDAYQYWTRANDRAAPLAPWLYDLLTRVEGLKELADATSQWIAARKEES